MRILFICKHNVFRSKFAEAYFKKINKNPNIKVASAGIIRGIGLSSRQKQGVKAQRQSAKKFGVKIKGKSRGLSVRLLRKQDVVILVADDLPPVIFNNKDYVKKLIVWKIPDEPYNQKTNIKKTIKLIINKVRQLSKQLKDKK